MFLWLTKLLRGLFRGNLVENGRNCHVHEVRQPHREAGRHGAGEHEHLAELQEEDIQEGKADTLASPRMFCVAISALRSF